MSTTFESEYRRLNDNQKKAVDTVEGPVMCVAGPGTGKTQVLALRVANILRTTQARPGNILCLTFSSSGATAMRERLRALIGADAYRVTVSTIHGYCNDIIASHPSVFEEWSALEQISDVERYREVNTIVDQLLPDCILVSKKNPYGRTKDILSRIALLKREGKTNAMELAGIADAYDAHMAVLSREGTKAHEKNLVQARKFREFIDVFLRYQQMLQKTCRYDYEDMILSVIRSFEQEDWMLATEQERYQYILVDEFQDTNGSQYRVIELLTTPRTPEDKPNLFVVGDDDQAIYRFQGANLTNILSFVRRFPSAPVIPLTVSYRCTQHILDAAGSLIANNTDRLVGRIEDLQKTLVAGSGVAGQKPAMLLSPSDATEPFMVADIVEDRLAGGIPPTEIAILTQTNAELRTYFDVLRARGIPAEMTGKIDLLEHVLVRQLITVLVAVHHPYESRSLADAMSCACFGCHPADLGRMFAERREKEVDLQSLLLQFGTPGGQDPVPLHRPAAVLGARDCILDLHQKLGSRTLVETLECALRESGLLKAEAEVRAENPIDPIDYAALQDFFDRVKYRCYESPSFSFESLMSDLEFYVNPEYGDLRLRYSVPHLTDAGVQLMTAHQSKGLEFRIVILPNFRDGHWNDRHNPSSLSIPEDLLFGWEKERKDYEKNQDERRVAFVAMTRAKDELVFTCPLELASGERAKAVSPSAFFAEAGDIPEIERELRKPEEAMTLLLAPARDLDAEFQSFLQSRLENFALSVTALNHFLEDPQNFLLSDLMQLPQSKKAELVYGNAVHDALRSWALAVQKGEELSQEAFISRFESYLTEREVLTDAEHARLAQQGRESLPRYYQQRLANAKPVVGFIEHSVTTRLGDPADPAGVGIPIKGKLDRIDRAHLNSPRITVIDYKTGRPKSENEIRDGDYFRQLVFYSLLIENGMPAYEPTEFILDFVGEGTDHPIERRFAIGEDDKRELRSVITAVWQKVTALDFSPLS